MGDLLLRLHELELTPAGVQGAPEQVEDARHRAAEGDARVTGLEQVGGEQGGGDVAGAVGLVGAVIGGLMVML